MRAFLTSVHHALRGIGSAWQHERNLRVQMIVALLVVIAGMMIRFSYVEWSLAVIAIVLVLGGELINTAFEHILDFLSPGHSDEVKFAKDVMAGMVLVESIGALVIGALIFAHHFPIAAL